MDKEQQFQQLLSSVAGILDDAADQMGVDFHYAIITSYPTSPETVANHFISNVQDDALEQVLIGAIRGMTEAEKQLLPKDGHLQ